MEGRIEPMKRQLLRDERVLWQQVPLALPAIIGCHDNPIPIPMSRLFVGANRMPVMLHSQARERIPFERRSDGNPYILQVSVIDEHGALGSANSDLFVSYGCFIRH